MGPITCSMVVVEGRLAFAAERAVRERTEPIDLLPAERVMPNTSGQMAK